MSAIKLYPHRNHIINRYFPHRLSNSIKLLMAFPKIQQVSQWHKPHFFFLTIQQCCSIINKSDKQFFIAYPTSTFFDGSLSICLFVPFIMLAMMAFLYSANSKGVVNNSISSSVSSSFFASRFLKL